MSLAHLELPIEGMTCASCAVRVEKKLNKLDGVSATVNLATEKAAIDYDPAATAPEALVGAVEAAGYRAKLPTDAALADEPEDPARAVRVRLLVSAALSLPVVLLAMVRPLQFDY